MGTFSSCTRIYTSATERVLWHYLRHRREASIKKWRQPELSRKLIDVSGECTATYSISGSTVLKSLTDCVNIELSGQHQRFNQMLGVTTKPETEIVYQMRDGIIETGTSSNQITTYVNMRPSLNSVLSVKQVIKLVQSTANSESIKPSSEDDAVLKVGSAVSSSFGMDMLPSIQEVQQCTENCQSPAALLSKSKDVLTTEKMASRDAAKAFLDLVRSFRNVGKSTIEEVITGSDAYYIVPQLIDIGVAAQTESGQQALMDLLTFGDDFSIEYPERYLLAAAFTSHPSEFLVRNLLNLMQKKVPNLDLRESVVLSLGAVINTFYRDPANRESPVIEEYRKAVLDELNGCNKENEGCQLMYIRSLGNAGLLSTLPTVLKYAEDGMSPSVSTAAILALRRLQEYEVTDKVLPVLRRIFHESRRLYDIGVRSTALEALLQQNPSTQDLQNIISLCAPPVDDVEFSSYVLEKLMDTAKADTSLRQTLLEAVRSTKIQNYNIFAQKGLSSAVSSYLAVTPVVNATYGLYMANSKSGLMKQSSMQVVAVAQEFSLPLLNFGLYADGIEALLSDEEGSTEGEEAVEPTAGMSLTIMDVLLRPIEFFRGSSGLMSAVWNAPSEPVSALQVNLLLQDHSQRLHLSNGLVANLQVMGAASVDLSGSVSISLWNRNSNSAVINSGTLVIDGSLLLESEELQAGMTFSAEGGSSIHFITDVDFYEMPLKMCLQMSRPSFTFSEKYKKFEKHRTSKKTLTVRKKRESHVNEASFILHKYNSRQCRDLLKEE